jgi:hypothetical protein
MTDLTSDLSTPISLAERTRLSIRMPRLAFNPGRIFLATFEIFGKAMEMAYVAPYHAKSGKSETSAELLPDGRDPNW